MIAFVRKNLGCLILKHNSPSVCRSPFSFSISLHFSSTSRESISPTISEILLHKYDFPPALASLVASKVADSVNPEKADSILSFFRESGFSNTQLAKIVRYRPQLLVASVENTIKPKFKILQDLGLSSDAICKLIPLNPSLLHLSMDNNIIPSLSVIEGLVGSNGEVGRVIGKAPRLLTANLQNTVVPNVEFLKSCGVPMHRIRSVLRNLPSFFLIKPDVVRESAEKAKEMGVDASSKSYIYAISTIATLSNEVLELKLLALRDLGFSDSHILTMFSNAPLVLYASVEKVKKVKELLLATGKFDLSSIVSYPMSLGYSIEKRYIPRLRILGILESRNLIEEWPGLTKLCISTDALFFQEFIRPYLNEISDVYVPKSSSKGTGKNEAPLIR